MTVDRSRVLRVLATALLVAAVLPFVVHAVPEVVGADRSYVVLSGSMAPAIHAGDVVVVDAVDPERVDEGDVITFRRSNEATPTTHRVVDVVQWGDTTSFETKGDANDDADPGTVPASALIGRVLFAVPYVGHVVAFAGTRAGFLTLVVAPFAALAFVELRSVVGAGRVTPATASDDAGSTPDDAEPGTDRDGTDADGVRVSVSPTDLRLSLAVLVCFAAYAGWQAVLDPTRPLRVSVAVGAVLGTLVVSGMYVAGRSSDASKEE